jgi:hypothetical protein
VGCTKRCNCAKSIRIIPKQGTDRNSQKRSICFGTDKLTELIQYSGGGHSEKTKADAEA